MLSSQVIRPPRFAAAAGLVAAVLVAVASLGGVALPSVYAQETLSWRVQGMAQDWVDLLVAAPWLAITALLALRGSRRGALLLGGGLAYTAYSFTIYAMAVHFNVLFLAYVAILGLSVYGLVDLGRALAREPVGAWFDPLVPRRLVGTTLIAFALLFTLLWLAQILPALASGVAPPELAEVGLVTNPVHVLDLAIVLPLLVLAGVLLRRGRDAGYALGVILLGFSVLMDLAILAMMVALRRHELPADDVVTAVFTAVTIFFTALLAVMLRAMDRGPQSS